MLYIKNPKRKVKALLIANDIKIKDVAQKAGVDISVASKVINGIKTSKRVKKVVAELLQMPYEEVWSSENICPPNNIIGTFANSNSKKIKNRKK